MKNQVKLFLIYTITAILFFGLHSSWAKRVSNPYFDLKSSTQQVLKLEKKIKRNKFNAYNLQKGILSLEVINDKADHCIDEVKEKLANIKKIFKNGMSTHEKESLDYQLLQQRKEQYSKILSECRYFTLRVEETLTDAKKILHTLTTKKLLTKNSPIWVGFSRWDSLGSSINNPLSPYSLSSFEYSPAIVILAIILVFFFFRLTIAKLLQTTDAKTFTPLKRRLLITTKVFLPYLLTFGIISTLFITVEDVNSEQSLISILCYTLFFYCLNLSILYFLFHPEPEKERFNPLKVPPYFNKKIFSRLLILSTILFVGYFTVYLFREQSLPTTFEESIRSLYIITLSVCMFWAIWPVLNLPIIRKSALTSASLKMILSMLLVVILILECIGFHQLVIYVVYNSILTIGLLILSWAIYTISEYIYHIFTGKKSNFSKKSHQLLGVKPHKSLIEPALIKFSLYAIFLAIFIINCLVIWQVPTLYIDAFEKLLLDGFDIANISIIPSRLIMGLIIFSLLNLIGRFIATKIAKTYQFKDEKDTQVALASIFSYLGFSVALVIALMISGFNFTGLAIIIGALSVGIGLGLQTIVNNFISGIILLLEKPIKPGDRILVGDTEGFVNKIRVRSTQIKTLAREDVIVPNSDLITNQVTNYMFRDRNWRITCQVGVAYGSDTELVRKVLLDVARDNPFVVKDSSNPPTVLFKTFGDSSLNFELWCVINDVNRKHHIASDLNFAIDKAFRVHNITIAFPQRDIHIIDEKPAST